MAENQPIKVVGYCRVSTEDKGQDPLRQKELLQRWADYNKVHLAEVVLDEGTSGSVSPLTRKKVKEAIALAKQHGAEGLVVETADRWTRGGLEDGVMSRAALLQEHRLALYMTDMQFGMDKMLAQIMLAIRDAMAEDWLRRHKARVAQGLRRASEKGWPKGKPGNPGKEPLNLEEQEIVRQARLENKGWGQISVAIQHHREAHLVADARVRRERSVSDWWVRDQWRRLTRGNSAIPSGPVGLEPVAAGAVEENASRKEGA